LIDLGHTRKDDPHNAVTTLAHKRKRLAPLHADARKQAASHHREAEVQAHLHVLLATI
jgi:hypothetical protein